MANHAEILFMVTSQNQKATNFAAKEDVST